MVDTNSSNPGIVGGNSASSARLRRFERTDSELACEEAARLTAEQSPEDEDNQDNDEDDDDEESVYGNCRLRRTEDTAGSSASPASCAT